MGMKLPVILLMSLALFVSCSDVQFKDVAPGDGISQVHFDIDWSGVEGLKENYPGMTVMMSRVKSATKHYIWKVDGEGNYLNDEEDVGSMFNGQYILLGFSAASKGVNIVGADDSLVSEAVRMTEICAQIDTLTEQQVKDMGVVVINNPMKPFIFETSPMYCAVADNTALMQVPSEENLILKPETMTCNYSVSGTLRAEEDVEIISMAGVISGVPYKVNLMSGLINKEETGKVYFEIPVEKTSDTPDGDNMYSYTYSGNVDALGLFLSSNAALDNGDGILEIVIRTRVIKKSDVPETPEIPETPETEEPETESPVAEISDDEPTEYFREFNVALNLLGDKIEPEVSQDIFMRLLEDKTGHVLNCHKFDFKVSSIIKITRSNVTSDSEGGLEDWKSNDDCSDSNLNPGLNPEV